MVKNWPRYVQNCVMLVVRVCVRAWGRPACLSRPTRVQYVIDTTARANVAEAMVQLMELIKSGDMAGKPVFVALNKWCAHARALAATAARPPQRAAAAAVAARPPTA